MANNINYFISLIASRQTLQYSNASSNNTNNNSHDAASVEINQKIEMLEEFMNKSK